jgi:CoA:oxalate CoA-transferase
MDKTKTTDEIEKIMKDADVPCTRLPTFDQVCKDPQLLSRNMIIEVDQPISGKVKVPGSLFKMSKTPGNIQYPAPTWANIIRKFLRDAWFIRKKKL